MNLQNSSREKNERHQLASTHPWLIIRTSTIKPFLFFQIPNVARNLRNKSNAIIRLILI